MESKEKVIRTFIEVARDASAIADAALSGDWEEARFRAELVAVNAANNGYSGVALAAAQLIEALGPPSGDPTSTHVAVLTQLADALDDVRPPLAHSDRGPHRAPHRATPYRENG